MTKSDENLEQYHSPYNLPSEHMRLVGIISAHWEYLELIINRAISYITMNDYGNSLYLIQNINFNAKMSIIEAYILDLKPEFPSEKDELSKMIQEIRAVNIQRNNFVHALWDCKGNSDVPTRVVDRIKNGKLVLSNESVKISELNTVAEKIYTVSEKFGKLLIRFGMPESLD